MQRTPQQEAIAKARLKGVTKVSAYAGTGKTSALTFLAAEQSAQGRRGLYLAFNKSAETDAKSRFPVSSVITKTVHALAFSAVGKKYVHKLRNLKSMDVIKLMGLSWDWKFARMVLDTLTAYCASAAIEFPETAISIQGAIADTPMRQMYAAKVAKQLWERMVDANSEAPMTHDGYLKLYQLNQPHIVADYIMLDEGQDTNPVTWDIVRQQTCPLVIVGDKYQSIYQFRGAFNAMDTVECSQEFPLTQSFRFGHDLARIANALLWSFYGEPVRLEGLGPNTRIGDIDPDEPHAVISRTNAAIFTHAVQVFGDNYLGRLTTTILAG